MKQVIYACIAVIFYALGNVITEQKLKPYTQFATMIYCYTPMIVMTLCALAFLKSRGATTATTAASGAN